jgi:hypothetical protein
MLLPDHLSLKKYSFGELPQASVFFDAKLSQYQVYGTKLVALPRFQHLPPDAYGLSISTRDDLVI